MNPDEAALLRAVVAAPGDALARGVYTDWLDEHGDPRGAYVWAEAEARGDGAALAPLAAGLCPVWVARVSRPPVGVCADNIEFGGRGMGDGPPLTEADLDAFAAECGAPLPAAYRAFLLNHNGGYPYPCQLSAGRGAMCLESFGMVPPAGWDPDEHVEDRGPYPVVPNYEEHASDLGRVLWIGQDGNSGGLLLGLEGAAAGRVYWHPDIVHEDIVSGEYTLIAESLPELFPLFVTTDPDWLQLIKRGDLPGFIAWLAAGGDPNAVDRETDWRPLGNAAIYDRPDMVRLLLAARATVTENDWHGSEQTRNLAIKAMIRAVCPTKPPKPNRKRKS